MTRGSSLQELHDAIYDILTGDATLMTHVTGVFDFVPEDQLEPYIQIHTPTEVPWDMFGTMGQRDTVTVDVWSKYRGSAEVKDIQIHINNLLDRASLSLSGYDSIWIRNTLTTDMRDPDLIHWHGIQHFTVYVNQS